MSDSPRMLRAELPVHKNKTLYGRSLTDVSPRAIGRTAWFACFRLHLIGPVDSALAGRQERLPFNALRILDPAFLALSVAASRLTLFNHRTFGALEPLVHFLKFRAIFDLNAEMVNARRCIVPADGKVHARILEHPLGIVVFCDDRFGAKELPIKSDRRR